MRIESGAPGFDELMQDVAGYECRFGRAMQSDAIQFLHAGGVRRFLFVDRIY